MAMKEKFEQHTAEIRAEVLKLSELGDREGLYIWEKLTEQGGESLGYVVADDEASYPDGGMQDGYWYKRVTDYTGPYTITPSTSNQTIPANALLKEILTIAGDADLIANNIRSGVNIFGVLGTMTEGRNDIDWGIISISYGSTATELPAYHSLGVTPTFVALIPLGASNIGGKLYGTALSTYANKAQIIYGKPNSSTIRGYSDNSGKFVCTIDTSSSSYTTANATKVNFKSAAGFYYDSSKFLWVAIVL